MINPSKTRKIASWILVLLLTAVFAMSAAGKLSGQEPMKSHFEEWGLSHMTTVIAVGEIVSALLFLIPRTSSVGTLLLSSHMGGAICIHMAHGELYVIQSIILVLVWVTQYLRYPELLVSFQRRPGPAPVRA